MRAWCSDDRTLAIVAVLLLVAIGTGMRFRHLDWDGWQQLHPDERGIWYVAQTIQLPANLIDAFEIRHSTLNPFRTSSGARRSFPYGHLPLYATVLTAEVLSAVTGMNHPVAVLHAGRIVAASADSLTILIVALLGREIGGRWAGVTAAGMAAFAVAHIQNAHFGTVDTFASLFATTTIWLLVRFAGKRRRLDLILAGASLGLAVACKITCGLLIVPFLLVQLKRPPYPNGRRPALAVGSHEVWLSVIAAAVAFVAANPYAILDPVPFVGDIGTQAGMVSGYYDWPFTRQYTGTFPIWYNLMQQTWWGLGFPMAIAAYLGLVWSAWTAIRRKNLALGVAASWGLLVAVVIGSSYVKFPRYQLIGSPTCLALAANMLVGKYSCRRLRRMGFWLAGLIVAASGVWAFAFVNMYEIPHPWLSASDWIYANLPEGSTLTADRWDDPLPLDYQGHLREVSYRTLELDPYDEPDSSDKLDRMLWEISQADYLILSSRRAWAVIPRLSDRYPYTAALYRALMAEQLGFQLEAHFARYPHLGTVAFFGDPFAGAGLTIPDEVIPNSGIDLGWLDESSSVYDHPLVLIFANFSRLSVEDLRRIVVQWIEQ